MATLIDVVV